jgi:hypothetical protein
VRGIDSYDLSISFRRIGERPEHVEDRADAHLPASERDVLHCVVKQRRVKKPNSNFVDALRYSFGSKLDFYAERFNNVGAATLRRNRTIPVLGYSNASGGDNKGSCGRNVEAAADVAPGSASIDERLAFGASDLCADGCLRTDARCFAAHDSCEAGQLIDRFALHSERREQRSYLRVCALPGHDLFEHRLGFFGRKVAAIDCFLDCLGDDHAAFILA